MSPLVLIYIILGLVYALYVLLAGGSPWYMLPINVLGGPIVVVYHLVRAFFYKPGSRRL